MPGQTPTSSVPNITSGSRRGQRRESGLRTVTAQLSVSPTGLARLLSISGAQSDFILASADGSTTVRVKLAVSSVPDAELPLGASGAVLDWARSTLTYRANRVSLTRMELRLLIALLDYAPLPAPREHLIQKLWGAHGTRAVERHAALAVWVCSLRRRLAAVGLPRAIRTVRNSGYAFDQAREVR